MRRGVALLAALLLGAAAPPAPVQRPVTGIFVAYPSPGHTTPFDRVLLEGSVPAGGELTIDGEAQPVGADGLFILYHPLREGENRLHLRSGSDETVLTVTSAPARALAAGEVEVLAPRHDSEHFAGAPALAVAVRAAPGLSVSARLGDGPAVRLRELPPLPPTRAAGEYRGELPLPGEGERLAALGERLAALGERLPVWFSVDGGLVGAPGRVTVSPGARQATVLGHDWRGVNPVETGAALPGGEWAFLQPGARVPLLALQGGEAVIRLGEHPSTVARALLGAAELPAVPPPVGTQPLAEGLFLRGAVAAHTAALSEDGRELRLRVWQDAAPWRLAAPAGALRGGELHRVGEASEWRLQLAAPARGVRVRAESGGLRVAVLPRRVGPPGAPLRGLRLVVDPGHGGDNFGGRGSFGVHEKDLVLPIALELAELLRAAGAEVRLTREDDTAVPLYDRALLASDWDADALVSVHANAIPDGVDPAGRRGVSALHFHAAARPLAAELLRGVLGTVPELGTDRAGVLRANLGLTRPETQPSVLLELGYLTDAENLRALMRPEVRSRLARGIADGLAAHFSRP